MINAPYGFSTIWNFVKPWLSRETQEKVFILGSDYKHKLLDLVEPENLPTHFGGSCTCSEAGGCMTANSGPWMIDREERREKWLRGELPRPGLSLKDRKNSEELQKRPDQEVVVSVGLSPESVKDY